MPSNTAAWLVAEKARPLEIKEAPYTHPAEDEIIIKNGAVAINPVDVGIQSMGNDLFNWMKYPNILGHDCAGQVVEVGAKVNRFKPGDRVLGQAIGLVGNKSHSAFQHYTNVLAHLASPIPPTMSYESACVLPLCLSTAACGLFQQDYLALDLPTVPFRPQNGKTLVIWGGASSVGCSAIQLAVAAGYEVTTTCSPHNFALMKSLGAAQVFDYNSPTVTDDMIAALADKPCAGALSITRGSDVPCLTIVDRCPPNGTNNRKFVAMALHVPESLPAGVGAKFIFGSDLKDNEVGPAVYEHFLPAALDKGLFVSAPEPLVVGQGLEAIQTAMDVYAKGVSAKKVVVSL